MDVSLGPGFRAAWTPGLVLALSLLAACADNPPPDHPGHGDWADRRDHADHDRGVGDHGGAAVNIFYSPAGRPYRAGPRDPYPSVIWFASADTDGDGRVTRQEFLKDAEVFFHQLDTDHDGIIDGFELTTYEKVVAPEIVQGFRPARDGGGGGGGATGDTGGGGRAGGRHGGGGGRHGGGQGGQSGGAGGSTSSAAADTKPQGASWFSYLDVPEPVAAADRQLDNRITLKEFLATADERFRLLDVAGRGYLVFDELPKTPVQLMRGGGGGR
jgi:hypothetical protein